MKSNIVLIVGLLVMIISLFGFIPDTLNDLNVSKTGSKIAAVITKLPKYGRNHRYDVRFKYSRKEFYYGMTKSFCENNNVGDTVVFLHNPLYKDKFLIPGGTNVYYMDIVISLLFALFGLFIIIKRKEFAEKF